MTIRNRARTTSFVFLAAALVCGAPATAIADDSDAGSTGDLAPVASTVEAPPRVEGDKRNDLHEAQDISAGVPDQLAGAWVDPETGGLVMGATPGASGEAEQVLESAGLEDTVRVDVVAHSADELDEIVDHVYDLEGAETVGSAWHDWANNRVVVTAPEATTDLRATLAEAYGDAVAIQEEDTPFLADSRNNDGTPFFAGGDWVRKRLSSGALIGQCTTGFAWKSSTNVRYLMTAGHCMPKGSGAIDYAVNDFGAGSYTNPVGVLSGNSHTTFQDGTGTVDGNGDLAIINVSTSGNSAGPTMWVGEANSSSTRTVNGVKMWAANGDPLCYSGRTTGAYCSYTVYDTDSSFKADNTGTIQYQMVKASKGDGQCVMGGDSGAPVYQRQGDTGSIAFGIVSGGAGGGDDGFIGSAEGVLADCHLFFTAVGQAYQQWSGGGGIVTQ